MNDMNKKVLHYLPEREQGGWGGGRRSLLETNKQKAHRDKRGHTKADSGNGIR